MSYSTYKRLFSECEAKNYNSITKKIEVVLPDAYVNDKTYIPEGWCQCLAVNSVIKKENGIKSEIIWFLDNGFRFYEISVSFGKYVKSKKILCFTDALNWCNETELYILNCIKNNEILK